MLRCVITGGQTGVDQAAWRAAKANGLDTGGLMPRGFLTEDGPRPDFAAAFGAAEHPSEQPDARTAANIRLADGTLVIADGDPGPGTALTTRLCREFAVAHRVVHPGSLSDPPTRRALADWIVRDRLRTLNVAGDRESHREGLGASVEADLRDLFASVKGHAACPASVPDREGRGQPSSRWAGRPRDFYQH